MNDSSMTSSFVAFACLLIVLVIHGCDTMVPAIDEPARAPNSILADADRYTVEQDTSFLPQQSEPSALGEGALFFELRGFLKADFFFEPVEIYTGGQLAVTLLGTPPGQRGTVYSLARMTQWRNSNGVQGLDVDVSGLGTREVAVEFYHKEELVYEIDQIEAANEPIYIGAPGSEVGPSSWHFEKECDPSGCTIVIVYDYELNSGGAIVFFPVTDPDRTVICSHIRVKPINPSNTSFSIQGVEFGGENRGSILFRQ